MKTAIVYDRVNKWGGAERVLLSLHSMFPEATLYTSVFDKDAAGWAKVFPKIKTSFLQTIPHARKNHEYYALLMPLAFESFDFKKYDLVISVTTEAAKGIITPASTTHICYCLTPTRYLWSGYKIYFSNIVLKFLSKPVIAYLRRWDTRSARRVDSMIAISAEVQQRIKRHYKMDAVIIYPPYNEKKFFYKPGIKKQKFFLVVSRFVAYKKVDLVIKAFNELGDRLIVVGNGREKEYLHSIARENIEFLEDISDKKLVQLYRSAQALVFPQREDFGIVSVEAQACGTPVIAYQKGGASETVINSKTGILFERQTKSDIIRAIKKFKRKKFSKKDCIKNAERFSEKNFKKNFLTIIK